MNKDIKDFFDLREDGSGYNTKDGEGLVVFPPDIAYQAVCPKCNTQWAGDIEIINWYPILTDPIYCPNCGKKINRNSQ